LPWEVSCQWNQDRLEKAQEKLDNGRFHRNLLTIQDEWKNIWFYVLETGTEDIGKNWGTYSRCMKALCIIFCQAMKPGFANISRENSCTVKSLSCQIKGELGTLAFFYPISCHNISILLSHFLLLWNDFSSSFQPLFGCMLTQNQVFV